MDSSIINQSSFYLFFIYNNFLSSSLKNEKVTLKNNNI